MKDVSTKPVGRGRPYGPLIVTLLLMMIASAIYFLVKPASLPPPELIPDTSVTLFEAEAKDLLSFTVKRPGEEAYTVSRSGDGYLLEGHAHYQLNLQLIDRMAESLAFLSAAETLENNVEASSLAPEEFGLGTHALEIGAIFSDGREYTVLIGSRVPGELPRDYGMLRGSKALYAFGISLKDEFDHPKTWLHTVPDINFTPDLLDAFRLETKDKSMSIRQVFDDVWVMDLPFSYPVSNEKVNTLKTHINNMRFAGYVDLASRLSLKDYGLDDPAVTVTFHLAPSILTAYSDDMKTSEQHYVDAQQLVLAFGNETNGIGYYCLFDGTVYQVTKLSMGFLLDTDIQSWLSSYPVNVPLTHIDTFSAAMNDEKIKLRVEKVEDILPNNDLSRNELGEILYRFVLTEELGREIDLAHGLDLYQSLMAIRAIGAVDHPPLRDSEALLSVELSFGDTSSIIKCYPYDALHALIEVDGTSLYYTDMSYLEDVKAALAKLSEK